MIGGRSRTSIGDGLGFVVSASKRTSSAASARSARSPGATQRGDEDRGGLGPELGERPVAVLAHSEVDLRGRRDAEPLDDVDEEPELDAPPLDERQRLEHVASPGVLTRERLHERVTAAGTAWR